MSERTDSADPHEAGQALPASGGDHVVLRHTFRVVLAIALVLYFIAVTLVFGLRYLLLPHVDALRPRIEALVSEKIHAELSIGKLAPHWTAFQPGIDVTDLTIRGRDGKVALTLPHAIATVSWSSIWQFTPVLSSLIVDQPDVLIAREPGGALSVAGVQMPSTHTGNDTFSSWLLRQQAIVLRGGTLRWHDASHDAPEVALHNIRLAILNDGYDHHFALQAPPDGDVLHGPLDFRAHFRHGRRMPIGKPLSWSGQAYLSTGPVDLPALARHVDFPIETFAGRIDNAIWINFAEGRMTSAGGQLAGADVSMRVRPTQPRLDVPVAHFTWQLDMGPGDYTLQLTNLRAELGQPPLDDGTLLTRTLALATLTAHYRKPSIQNGQLITVAGDRVDLGMLAEFSRALPFPRRLLNELVRFNPRGQMSNYVIELERAKPDSGEAASERRASSIEPIVHYRFKGNLEGISIAAQEPPPGLTPLNHPRAGLPGVENLWGSIDSDETHGSMTLDTANVAITFPGVFDNPRLKFDHLQAHSTWVVSPTPGETHKAFAIKVSDLYAANADTAANLTANYSNPGHGRGSLDLKATFERAQVTRIPRYLPTSISEKLRIYLGHGLQAGTSHGATIEIHGDLTKFPYNRFPDAGIFHIVAPFKGGKFDPSPYPPRTLKNGTPNVWPPLDGIDGVFELKQNVLRFDVDRAHYERVALTKVAGKIDDLGTKASSLVIRGDGHGPLADMLDYVNSSALAGLSKHAAEKVKADGPATLALQLTIPRTPKPHIAVEGALGFDYDRLVLENVPPLSRLSGKVRFTEHTAEIDHISGQFLGGDIHANGAVQQNGAYAFDLNGHIAVDAARGLNIHGPAAEVLARLSGSAPYALSVHGNKGQAPALSANSDLTGLALDFPAPLNKPVGTPMPLKFTLQPDASTGEAGLQRANLTFGPIAATYLLRHAPQHPPEVVAGAIGVNRPAELPSDGVIAAVDLDTFDADAWRALINRLRVDAATRPVAAATLDAATKPATTSRSMSATALAATKPESAPAATPTATKPDSAPAATPAATTPEPTPAATPTATTPESTPAAPLAATPAAPPAPNATTTPATNVTQFLPNRFAVHIGTLTLLKRHWENVIVGASHMDGKWQANIASSQVSGHVVWLPGATKGSPGTLEARLARLVIPAATENDLLGQAISTPAQNMPTIDLVVNQLIVRGHDFGRLEVDAHNFDESGVPVWQLDKLEISNPAATLSATGNWRTAESFGVGGDAVSPRRTVFDFKLDIKDAGALLERAGQPRTIKAGTGTLSGRMLWRGGPAAIDYPTLDGELSLDLHHGEILKVDPGVAKLLGVLSLQSLARFATLNFRDVIGEGLPFEKVTGTGQISNGIGHTDNFEMVTAPARVEMKGAVNLAKETQDLHVQIVPTVSAGAGVIAAAVINPLIGLGALVADFALSHSISSFFGLNYEITGSWSKPHIERLHGDRGKMDAPASEAVAH